MMANFDRYKSDLGSLIETGEDLLLTLKVESFPEIYSEAIKAMKPEEKKALSKRPFSDGYQRWYSEALMLVKQLLPDRLVDFIGHYKKPKTRKELTYESYRIEDKLQGLTATRGHDKEK